MAHRRAVAISASTSEHEQDDGTGTTSYSVHGMYVLELRDGKLRIKNGSRDLKGTLWVTDQRIAVVCKQTTQ
jgi:hypothetical protein